MGSIEVSGINRGQWGLQWRLFMSMEANGGQWGSIVSVGAAEIGPEGGESVK